jgi:rod shape-determining protein MreD
MNMRNDRFSTILITIAVAFVLTLVPLPALFDLMRPYWIALVIIYWGLETQDHISLGLAFSIGILLDLLSASLLGLHALSLVIIVYLVTRFRARLRFFPPWQQALSVLALLINDRIILLWIISLRGEPLPTLDFWLPPIIGTALWPWLFLVLDRYRGVMRHRSGK